MTENRFGVTQEEVTALLEQVKKAIYWRHGAGGKEGDGLRVMNELQVTAERWFDVRREYLNSIRYRFERYMNKKVRALMKQKH